MPQAPQHPEEANIADAVSSFFNHPHGICHQLDPGADGGPMTPKTTG